jgi:glycerol-3-phosphate dehydrogenase (NAD(P)+)
MFCVFFTLVINLLGLFRAHDYGLAMSKQLKKVAVLGGGSFGTAIANILASNGLDTHLWMRSPEQAHECREVGENTRYLPGYPLRKELLITADLDEAIAGAELVFVSIPSHSFRTVIQLIKPLLDTEAMIISTAKGLEPQGFTLMSQILEQELPEHRIGVLSGPNFAKEIVQQQQTGSVIASESSALIRAVQETLCSASFRVYANDDRYGVELGGALKNIYAIVCGMAAALGAGKNTQAMLLTRSLAEMGRFAQVMGANPMTFLGLAGVGDLILTCTSDLSRNYRVGFALGEGKPLDDIVANLGQVAEGVNTLRQVKQKADEFGLYAVLFQGKAIGDVVRSLMLGEQNYDVEYLGKK